GFASGLDGEKSVGALATVKYKGLSLQGILTSRDKDIPTAPYETIFGDPTTRTRDRRAFLEVKFENPLDLDKRIMVRGYVDGYRYEGNWAYDPPSFDAANGSWGGAEAQFLWDILPTNRLVCGGEYRNNWKVKYRSWDASTVYFDRNKPFSLFSLYVQDDLQMTEDLSVTLGLRHDSYSDKGASTMPRAMIVFWPTHNTSVKLGYGEAFRAPNFYESYYEDLPTQAKANPAVKPEQMRTLELILEQRLTDEISASLSLYKYRMTNLIDQVVDPADSFSQYQNRSSVDASGAEFEVRAKLPWGQFVRASYSRQRTHDEVTE
ncbi:MAG TPA: hypothetical protein DGH68_11120, partial [Bacteroidetes bacterium]|nr:hypothetical protein [Bacteroidota bacterium]